jgi:hypothetical protein
MPIGTPGLVRSNGDGRVVVDFWDAIVCGSGLFSELFRIDNSIRCSLSVVEGCGVCM